jgi:hypothetical protein
MAGPNLIELEGGIYREVQRTVVRELPLSQVMPELIVIKPVTTPVMPRSHIMSRWDESQPPARKLTVLCELQPALRVVRKSNRKYRLAMPWTYFIFRASTTAAGRGRQGINAIDWGLENYSVFHAKDRVTGPDSTVITALLPNVYESGEICFGQTGADGRMSIQDRIDALVNEWYLTEFNSHVLNQRAHPFPFNSQGWAEWVKRTRENPVAWNEWPEWDDPSIRKWTIAELMDGEKDRMAPIEVVDRIPELVPQPTFGRATQWVTENTNRRQRRALRAALDEFVEPDEPEPIEPETMNEDLDANLDDDGGEPV